MAKKRTSRRAKAPTKRRRAGPKIGALEKRVDGVLRTEGLSLNTDLDDLIEKAERRTSKFVPGKPRKRKRTRRKKAKTAATPKSARKAKKPKKKTSSRARPALRKRARKKR
jgi:hypothetical protein